MDTCFHDRSNYYLIYPYFRCCRSSLLSAMAGLLLLSGCNTWNSELSCFEILLQGDIQHVAQTREQRFLGKVPEKRAHCLGGDRAVTLNQSPWLDWPNFWATGDGLSLFPLTLLDGTFFGPNARGINGALYELELQRIELIKFNLFDNNGTYQAYITGRDGKAGPMLQAWPEMQLPPTHLNYQDVESEQKQVCRGDLIRFRTVTGICNDIYNPLMGSTHQLFARNVQFDTTFPDLGLHELTRNRHGERLALLKPDPQVISRKILTRMQSHPDKCQNGYGLLNSPEEAECDYKKAPTFNVLAAFWIQFMTHDWFSHVDEESSQPEWMKVGCATQRVDNSEQPLTVEEVTQLGCRPDDKINVAPVADDTPPESFMHNDRTYLTRAPKTTRNHVTAWWDASQLYGYDKRSSQRVKRDPGDPAKILLVPVREGGGEGDKGGYLPIFDASDPIKPEWSGQESTAFPDNWSFGLSFFHNVFAREHNAFVDEFHKQAAKTPDADSGLRNPGRPEVIIHYQDVTPDELFNVARLVVSAEIAKIHTIEWTTQLLYNEPLYRGMNANWHGLFHEHTAVSEALREIIRQLDDVDAANNSLYTVFAVGAGIFGLGNHRYEGTSYYSLVDRSRKDLWTLSSDDDINGGVNHFGSPFNFPEEFVTVYRLHPLLPDLIEYREWNKDPNVIQQKIPIIDTFRGKATEAIRQKGLANWALSMGRQRAGELTLQNHPQFLQNLKMPHLQSFTQQIDIAALDLLRDRERGIPRYNEFRRQYGLKQLTRFEDFIDPRLPEDSPARREQEQLVKTLREVYGQHRCDESKQITNAQLNNDNSPINDCLGHPNGSLIDNIEDVDTMVGWLAEFKRPHGFAISETQFVVFILNASRRLFSDRFFTSSFRPEFYSTLGVEWVMHNGPGLEKMEQGMSNGHQQPVSPLKRVLLRTLPELEDELAGVMNVFDPWARDRGKYYSTEWEPRRGAEGDSAFAK
ncbi:MULTISPECIES: peroxidase family protein [Nitrosomonas]|uniref:Heme peroxidase n=2 Tax=Nitrosomonas communis TaxID=44574 RepID=A0A5D3YKY3_9PROT|nr:MULTISPECIES: peroxidase family protein [Nitrosomonas]TYP94277.1 heme peroxidase [Nitrosomonas communis]UVS60836.1 oxygenase [Nitrosomonas sp. PLL12]